jgi:hypothetical protein
MEYKALDEVFPCHGFCFVERDAEEVCMNLLRGLLFVVILGSAFVAQAADGIDQGRFNQLYAAAQEQCHIPAHINPYSQPYLNRFLAQVFDPELKMLNTAFQVGFSFSNSANISVGYCVIVFMGLPDDPEWEKDFNFYQNAANYNALPEKVYGGFDERET